MFTTSTSSSLLTNVSQETQSSRQEKVDLNAENYVNNSALQNSLAKEVLNKITISSHARILDVGCGDGRMTAELAHLAAAGEVVGLDSSSSMIEFASKVFSREAFPNLRFQLGMAEEAAFAQPFDLIVSFSCFHWLKEPEKALGRLVDALKPKGELIALTYPKESPYYKYLQSALEHYPDYVSLSAYNTMLSGEQYKDFFLKNGLEIVSFEMKALEAEYNSYEDLKNYIKGWLVSYVCLPEHLQEDFLENVAQTVKEDVAVHKQGGKIALPYIALVMVVRK